MRIVIEHNGDTVELDRNPKNIRDAMQQAAQIAWSLKRHDGRPAKAKVYDGLDMVYQVNVP